MPDPLLQPVFPSLKFNMNFDPALVDPANPDALQHWRLAIPAKPACYVLCDADERPILLATTGNLRTALLHRLAGGEEERDEGTKGRRDEGKEAEPGISSDVEIGPTSPPSSLSSKTDYRAITRLVRYRICCSAFEADWAFLENAPLLFPRQYRPMIQHLRTHWLTVDPQSPHPQFTVTTQPDFRIKPGQSESSSAAPGSSIPHRDADCPGRHIILGPVATSAAARQTIDALLDLCDLCRYHEILVQAPHGSPCAYKEMGKCPAPCDGSISLDAYHTMIAQALSLLTGARDAWLADVQSRMKLAAGELKFEQAARWKLKLDRVAALDHPALRLLRPLPQWRGCLIQPGSRKNAFRPFIITPGSIRFLGEITPKQQADQLEWFNAHLPALLAHPPAPDALSPHRMALLARHLLKETTPGKWLNADQPVQLANC